MQCCAYQLQHAVACCARQLDRCPSMLPTQPTYSPAYCCLQRHSMSYWQSRFWIPPLKLRLWGECTGLARRGTHLYTTLWSLPQ